MAEEEEEEDLPPPEEAGVAEIPEDNAKELTSWLVIGTFIMSLVAFLIMERALGKWFAAGPFA
jgi:hypothetical protein